MNTEPVFVAYENDRLVGFFRTSELEGREDSLARASYSGAAHVAATGAHECTVSRDDVTVTVRRVK